ncbi:ATP-dependent helicase IRC3 [Spiroplasma litorale]|uniref:ATP-dependent helicase IRC3 n=1 Tax=Spiroplasma litorale TaxID=216942 RepID=A0A0K1W1X3_9MOLU|nr:DEAD/DEAH box helicase family protein [Spiroplasma litorale]AKX34309.1 ATP-dependent helicase IRC3 [Spiroplasma litorale]
MKKIKKGHLDLLLTNKNVNLFKEDDKEIIDNIDNDWLLGQLNKYLRDHLKDLNNINDKINFLNNILNIVVPENFTSIKAIKFDTKNQVKLDNLSKNELIIKKVWNNLEKEFLSSEFVYIISPFISAEMVNKLENFIKENKNELFKMIIITTTYDGRAKFLAIEQLVRLEKKYKDKVNIYIENLFERTNSRLHIKAYFFKRNNKFSTLYIGSSNFTKTGQIAGKEYNIKISEFKEPQIIDQFLWDFNNLINDKNFIRVYDEERIKELITLQQLNEDNFDQEYDKNNNINTIFSKTYNKNKALIPFDYQNKIINEIINRIKSNKKKHLLVMATGTGKTATMAFIYKKLVKMLSINSFIYIAPSKEILDQAMMTFRNILDDPDFGIDLYDGRNNEVDIQNENFIFITKDTLYFRIERFKNKKFEFVIFDEAHHVEAKTFKQVFEFIANNSKQVFGLTATPERTDGVNINKYFDYEHACELRLYDAIENEMLSDFDYYFIKDDTINLENLSIKDKKFELTFNNLKRYEFIYNTIINRIGKQRKDIRAILFCSSTQNAKELSAFLSEKGERSSYITTENNKNRDQNIELFKKAKINYLCVMNILNEGVDIPEVDTIFFLRPTTSLIIYLQQLGRGLRKSLDKKLQIYDFVNNVDLNVNNNFNPFLPFIHLTNNIKVNCLEKAINSINNYLPGNSNFHLTNLEKKDFIDKLKNYEKNHLFKSILEEYRADGTFEEYENYFTEKNVDIYDFYLSKNKTFFNENSKSLAVIKAFLFPNIKQLLEEIVIFLSEKRIPKSKLIKYIILASFYHSPNKKDIYYNDINLALELIFNEKNKLIIKEVLYLLKFKLKNEENLNNILTDNIESFIGVELNHSQMQALCSININEAGFKGKGVQGIIKNEKDKLFCIDANRTKTNLFSDSGNYYDDVDDIFYWDTPNSWKVGPKKLNDQQAEFLNLDLYKTYLFYNDDKISEKKTYRNRKLIGKVEKVIERKTIIRKNESNIEEEKLVLLLKLKKAF